MTISIYNHYPPSFDFQGKKVLNVGSGYAKYKSKDVVNLDSVEECKPDVVWDLEKTPLPFKDGEFDVIIANHIMEHIHNWWGLFNDLARVLKKGGALTAYLPGPGNDSQLGFRDHVSYINELSFYGTHGLHRAGGNAHAMSERLRKEHASSLRIVSVEKIYKKRWWINLAPRSLKLWMGEYLRNVIAEQGFFFVKV